MEPSDVIVTGCPLGGRNAPDIALGRHKTMLRTLAESSLHALLAERRPELSADECHSIEENYMMAVERVQMHLGLKTAVWDTFPLVLAGIAHGDQGAARAHCQALMLRFDAC